MIHRNRNKSSCIMYKNPIVKNHLANLVCARAPAIPIKSSIRIHFSRNEHQK